MSVVFPNACVNVSGNINSKDGHGQHHEALVPMATIHRLSEGAPKPGEEPLCQRLSVAALLGERSVVDPLERAERIAKAPDGRVDASQEKRAAGVPEEERVAGALEEEERVASVIADVAAQGEHLVGLENQAVTLPGSVRAPANAYR